MLARLFRFSPVALAALLIACGQSATSGPAPSPAPAVEPTAPPAATDKSETKAPNALADAVDALFTDAETRDAFSGSVIVVDGGKQVFEKGYGFGDRATKRKNTPDTLFRIGSVSKQFAATAI